MSQVRPVHLRLRALLGGAVLGVLLPVAMAHAADPAPTPPMGWNSWNAFGTDITEAKVVGAAQAISDLGLARLGYRQINIDDGWWLKRRTTDARMQVRTNLFPSAAVGGGEATSLRPLVDRLHAMGFKAGIYSDIGRNSCSQAWSPDNPNLPEGTVAEREIGLHDHIDQDIALYFGAWRFDYIKVDGCGISAFAPDKPFVRAGQYRALGPLIIDDNVGATRIAEVRALYTHVRAAITRVRPAGDAVLSLCNWGRANVRSWGREVGQLWRTSDDIGPTWQRMLLTFDSTMAREFYAGPGHWNDPDMLEVGNGEFDGAHLTEARAHMSLWAIAAAPLIIGTDLAKASPEIVGVLGAPEVIAINQDPAGNQGVPVYRDHEREVVVKTLSADATGHGRKAVALINRSDAPAHVTLAASLLALAPDQPIGLRDAWARADLGTFTGQRGFDLTPRQTLLLVATGTPVLAKGWYVSEAPARIRVLSEGLAAPQIDPTIYAHADAFRDDTARFANHPSYAGWGAPRAGATPFGEALRLGDHGYREGFGMLAGGAIEVTTAGAGERFTAEVGIDDSTHDRTTPVRFVVSAGGRVLARSPWRHVGEGAWHLTVPLHGVARVTLRTEAARGGHGDVVTTWGDARFE